MSILDIMMDMNEICFTKEEAKWKANGINDGLQLPDCFKVYRTIIQIEEEPL